MSAPGFRLDLFLTHCVGEVFRSTAETRCGLPLWDGGVKDLTAQKLKEIGVSDKPITLVDFGRLVGILRREDPEVIDVEAVRTNRKRRRP